MQCAVQIRKRMTQEGGSRYELPILAMRTRAMTQEAASPQ
nr:MAG TPA: hypothetical protein [Caudoviricetes sp.]DAW38896.1 MAG TPA: hypothetical protein [Caudoviricetes sp.]